MITITGANGFLGSYLSEFFAGRALRLARTGMEFTHFNLSDGAGCEAARGHHIVHTACSMTQDPLRIVQEDLAGMLYLTQHWTTGAFVYISSMDVYPRRQTAPWREAEVRPRSVYGWGKLRAEELLRLAYEVSPRHAASQDSARTGWTAMRCPYIFGYDPRFKETWIGKVIGCIATDKSVRLPKTGGFAWATTEIVADCVQGMLDRPLCAPCNISGGWVSWIEFFELCKELTQSRSELIRLEEDAGEGQLNTDIQQTNYPTFIPSLQEVLALVLPLY